MANIRKNVSEKIKRIGRTIGMGGTLGRIADWEKDTDEYSPLGFADLTAIKPNMAVVSCDGWRIGTVDYLVGGCIKLARKDSPDGLHHFIPATWVAGIDDKIYLHKDAEETLRDWDHE